MSDYSIYNSINSVHSAQTLSSEWPRQPIQTRLQHLCLFRIISLRLSEAPSLSILLRGDVTLSVRSSWWQVIKIIPEASDHSAFNHERSGAVLAPATRRGCVLSRRGSSILWRGRERDGCFVDFNHNVASHSSAVHKRQHAKHKQCLFANTKRDVYLLINFVMLWLEIMVLFRLSVPLMDCDINERYFWN